MIERMIKYNLPMIIFFIISIILIVLMVVSSNKNIVSTMTNDSISSNDMNHFLDYNNSDHILDKTIYSNYSRLLFVAGIDIHYYHFKYYY